MKATLFNQYKNLETNAVEFRRTLLSGERRPGKPAVHWENNKATNVIASGLTTADAVNVMIWFSVDAEGKTYLPPKAYAALPPEALDQHWTLAPQDRLVKGDVPDAPINDIVALYDDVTTITSVDTMDYGSPAMQHWEVSGK